MFALVMDYLVRPIVWVFSRRFREHQRYVRVQNTHLARQVHTAADSSCAYCIARSGDLRARGLTPDVDPRVLP